CRDKVAKAIRSTMFVAIPAAVGIGVLSRPIMLFLYPQRETLLLSANLLIILSIAVVFYSLSTILNAVLQSIGRVNSPVVNAALALIIQTAVLVAGLIFTDIGTYLMAVSVLLFALLMCVFNGIAVRKHLSYEQEWDKTFMRPLVISIVMGAVSFGTYHGLFYLININLIALVIAVTAGILVYFIIAVKWRVLGEAELKWIPGGGKLTRLVNRINKG
ncbi:MAG: polysaccharide biosynthesis C-terminal domain-containing protein, partial [Lachnospiraceae bacterium]|nr:polysaccharide biosynthesis C-terminal domain-containing protein [Lachnospiraceae bacterium]